MGWKSSVTDCANLEREIDKLRNQNRYKYELIAKFAVVSNNYGYDVL
jgi:hypothetical protein